MKLVPIFLSLGMPLWLVGCGEKTGSEKKLTLTPTTSTPTYVVKSILQPEEWTKPESTLNLPTERLEVELKHSLQNILALRPREQVDQSCFFNGIFWRGSDAEVHAVGKSRVDSCAVTTADGKELIYRNNQVELSLAIRCVEGGLAKKITPGTPILKFDRNDPLCDKGVTEVFYQSRMSGEIAYPLGSDTLTVTYKATSVRMNRDGGSCRANRENAVLNIEDNCMDVNRLETHYADKTNWMYSSFIYKSVGRQDSVGKLNRGYFEAELNDWVGIVTLTDLGADYELRMGDEIQKGHIE